MEKLKNRNSTAYPATLPAEPVDGYCIQWWAVDTTGRVQNWHVKYFTAMFHNAPVSGAHPYWEVLVEDEGKMRGYGRHEGWAWPLERAAPPHWRYRTEVEADRALISWVRDAAEQCREWEAEIKGRLWELTMAPKEGSGDY